MDIELLVPVTVRITDPVAAFKAYLEHWSDSEIDQDNVAPIDLVLHAGRIDCLEVTEPQPLSDYIEDVEWLYMKANSEDNGYITREDIGADE